MTANIVVTTYCGIYAIQVKKIKSMGIILDKIIQGTIGFAEHSILKTEVFPIDLLSVIRK